MNLIPWRKKHTVPVSHDAPHEVTHETHGLMPFRSMLDFRREMDHLFDKFFSGQHGWGGEHGWEWPAQLGWTGEPMPSVDVSENDERITIQAEVPGVSPEDLEISVSGNILTVRGEKKACSEEKHDDFYHSERTFGSFTRRIELPTTADLEKIEAEECNGVLTIKVAKQPAAHSKRVEVKGAVHEREPAGSAL